MLSIDVLGLIITGLLLGPRYVHCVLAASALAEAGRVVMTLFLQARVTGLLWGGLFGGVQVQDIHGAWPAALILFSGPLVNYIASSCYGGIGSDGWKRVINPLRPLTAPFAVINFRLAMVMALGGIVHLLYLS